MDRSRNSDSETHVKKQNRTSGTDLSVFWGSLFQIERHCNERGGWKVAENRTVKWSIFKEI